MIFVTVGHQTPFDRLVKAVDAWAANTGSECFAQIGDGDYEPVHMRFERWLSPERFLRTMREARAVVAHAGTGTILTAMQLGKSVLVLPRQSGLQETRNDHQIATARHFAAAGHVLAAADVEELGRLLPELDRLPPRPRIGGEASPTLVTALREFVQSSVRKPR